MDDICQIVIKYQNQGYKMTLRQLFYQLVTENKVSNDEREYRRLSCLVKDGRMMGLIDWDVIEDRGREPYQHSEFDDIEDLMASALSSYRLPRWADQDCYVELWVEKDALSGILRPLADKYHVTLMVNKGFSSATAMYEARKRFSRAISAGKKVAILYLGDHDPSGMAMTQDIQKRLEELGVSIDVNRIGLNFDQVRKFRLPHNPAKERDPRFTEYERQYGEKCWEVDALNPSVLKKLVCGAIEKYVNGEKMGAVIAQEERDKSRLSALAGQVANE